MSNDWGEDIFRYGPDDLFACAASSVFMLLKMTRPRFDQFLTLEDRTGSSKVIGAVIDKLRRSAVNEGHTAMMYASFLGSLLQKAEEWTGANPSRAENGNSAEEIGSPITNALITAAAGTCSGNGGMDHNQSSDSVPVVQELFEDSWAPDTWAPDFWEVGSPLSLYSRPSDSLP